jgi:hypothetical protein
MLSSTSSSELGNARWGIKVLLTAWAALLVTLELGATWLVPMFNWNMHRFHQECAQAISLGSHRTDTRASILLLGNSLTFTDINFELLGQELGEQGSLCRWAVDNTAYLDWYYGLRRAIRHGARPDFIIVGGRGSHFLGKGFRGWFFSHYIMDSRDLLDAGRAVNADATTLSTMGLAQISAFCGSREELYKRWLTLVLPSFPDLGGRMSVGDGNAAKVAGMPEALLSQRLHQLQTLCSQCGAQLIVWIPPMPVNDPYASLMLDIGAREHIPVIRPAANDAWTAGDFADGFHMTPRAATRFTELFATRLMPLLTAQARATASTTDAASTEPRVSQPHDSGISQ